MFIRRIVQSVPCKPLTVTPKILPLFNLVEEEHAPLYKPQHFYPVRLYEILNERYQLARDLYQWHWLPPRYVAIKFNANNYASQESAEEELRITEHITNGNIQHPGRLFVAPLLDSFRVKSAEGSHICMRRFEGNIIPLEVLKLVAKLVLEGLRYLHTECHVIHIGRTHKQDLKSDNILLTNREIYLSRNYWGLTLKDLRRPVITDFGLAPDGYRAPEVCLGCDWSYGVVFLALKGQFLKIPLDTPVTSTRASGSLTETMSCVY
ncbi:kinase-like domain-containing protein [Aspergillus venezuelensis]